MPVDQQNAERNRRRRFLSMIMERASAQQVHLMFSEAVQVC
jgi:hypothetical protein